MTSGTGTKTCTQWVKNKAEVISNNNAHNIIGEYKNLNDAFRKINNQIRIYSPLKDKIYFYNKKYLSYFRHKTKI